MSEAAQRLNVSIDTIRRRLRRGDLQGEQQTTPQGFIWLIEIPEDPHPGTAYATATAESISAQADATANDSAVLRELVEVLRREMDVRDGQLAVKDQQLETKDRQIGELHVLLQQAQAALPAPKENHHSSWWRFWGRQGS
jgi:hypothetical protein